MTTYIGNAYDNNTNPIGLCLGQISPCAKDASACVADFGGCVTNVSGCISDVSICGSNAGLCGLNSVSQFTMFCFGWQYYLFSEHVMKITV